MRVIVISESDTILFNGEIADFILWMFAAISTEHNLYIIRGKDFDRLLDYNDMLAFIKALVQKVK